MSAFIFNLPTNSSLFDVICLYWGTISVYLSDSFAILRHHKNKSLFDSLPETLHFDHFQFTLLKALILLLFVNWVLILVAWIIYGKRICDRFMKPATSKAIEELKASVSKLKLPKEHTPRI